MGASDDLLFSAFQLCLSFQRVNKDTERKVGVSLIQWCILKRLLDLPATSAQALAEAVGVHPSSLTQSLKRLSRKRLVFVGCDPRDSRRKVISITREGKSAVERVEQVMESIAARLSENAPEILRRDHREL